MVVSSACQTTKDILLTLALLVCMPMQALAATSERSFSKAGLIVAAKQMVMSSFHVDDLHLVGWRMIETGWATQKKEKRARPQARKKRKRRREQQSGQDKAPRTSQGVD